MKWYEKLAFARKILKKSLREVTDITGLSNPYLSMLETGKIADPSFFKMIKLMKVYNLSPSDIELNCSELLHSLKEATDEAHTAIEENKNKMKVDQSTLHEPYFGKGRIPT